MKGDLPPRERQQRIAKLTVALLLTLLGLWVSSGFLPSIVWAGVIAIAIMPLYARAEARWPRARNIALPTIATLAIALLILVPLALLLFEVTREARGVIGWVAQARLNGVPEPQWIGNLPFHDEISKWWAAHLATPEASEAEIKRFQASILLQHTKLVGRDLLRRGVVFFFTLLALFFVLRDREVIIEQCHRAGERLLGPAGERLGQQVILSVRGTIDGLVLVGIGEGVVLAIAYIVAGVPHPLLFGAVTAIAAMIPFGAPIIFSIAAVTLLVQGALGWAIGIMVLGTAVLFVADHIVRPVLIGGATRLPFLWVLIGILGGVETLGLMGLFVGPATMATLMLLWREYISTPAATPLPEA